MTWQGWASIDEAKAAELYWTVLEMEAEVIEKKVTQMVREGDDPNVAKILAGYAEFLRKRVENLKRGSRLTR